MSVLQQSVQHQSIPYSTENVPYKNIIQNYQGDCAVLLGKYKMFSDYIKEFAKKQKGNGLDIGAGPQGYNSKYFRHCNRLDGCDAEQAVLDSLSRDYTNKFLCFFGSDKLPYQDSTQDFIICSCMIQHLNSFKELEFGISEICRILKPNGQFYLMFKAGTNDTILEHTNGYYGLRRSFRVFDPEIIIDLCKRNNLTVLTKELLLDDNWIPYCCLTFSKN